MLPTLTEMDIKFELKALKGRISRLQEVFNSLPQYPPGPEEWPFWLEKFNALSGQFSGLERDLLSGVLQNFLLEPATLPQSNQFVPLESIPNILLRTKLAPEVTAHLHDLPEQDFDEPQQKLYKSALRALSASFSDIQDSFSAAVAEQTSALLAAGMQKKSESQEFIGLDEKEAFLESSIRWLYTGRS